MARLNAPINRDNLPKADEFTPLPKGKYNTRVTNTDYKIANNGRESIELTFDVTDGEYANRKIFGSFTMVQPLNPNIPVNEAKEKSDKAVNIGQKNLNSLMTAVNLPILNDTDDFLNKQVVVSVKITPETNGYPAKNDITGFEEYKGDTLPFPTKQNNTTVRTQKNAWADVPKQKPKETVVEEEVDVDDDEESAPGSRPW